MHSIGFYANCDEAIHNIIKDYIDKTYTEYVKYCEEISPLMRSRGFYLCMAESFQNQIKAFRDKTYNDAFKYFNELMKRDIKNGDSKIEDIEDIESYQRIPIPKNV